MNLTLNSLGMHDLVSEDGQYEVFEILHEAHRDQVWPEGPVLPEGHVVVMEDGGRYQIATAETVQIKTRWSTHQYMHRYTCTRDIAREW